MAGTSSEAMAPLILDVQTEFDSLQQGTWYMLSTTGDAPSARVGHAAARLGTQLFCIGGATPCGAMDDTFRLDLTRLRWLRMDPAGFTGRYEHSILAARKSIFVFGGADPSGNKDDIQVLDVDSRIWATVETEGKGPPARTHHTNAVVSGEKLVIYSGGHSGPDPVDDAQLYVFDVGTKSWSCPDIAGEYPSARQGHVMATAGNKVYIHGGICGTSFYDDLHVLDLDGGTWNLVPATGKQPAARAAHGGVSHGKLIYVFGGLGDTGALGDMFSLDSETLQWTCLQFDSAPPAPRLDFAMCLVQLRPFQLPQDGEGTSETGLDELEQATQQLNLEDEADSNSNMFILLHGGMDTEGEIFDDCFVLKL